MNILAKSALAASAFTALISATPSSAALTLFQSWVGSYGLSTDGGGSISGDYQVSAFIPQGATVAAAYLYQATNGSVTSFPLTFAGTSVNFGTFVQGNTNLGMARGDVTSIVAAAINGGSGGTFNFTVSESNTANTDGTALAVIYSLASLPESTVALLDGFSAQSGDTTALNFASPLTPSDPGFVAEMRLGIGYSALEQSSSVRVNGTLITEKAGDADDGAVVNGALITMGGNDDPFSPLLPTYGQDHERYDLRPYIASGSSTIKIDTLNPSRDDNIFLAAFQVSGRAGVNAPPPVITNAVPEPASWSLMIAGFGVVGAALRRQRTVVRFV